MKKMLGIMRCLIVLGGLMYAVMAGSTALPAMAVEGPNRGNVAPDFTLTGIDGEEITLSQYKGKKVMLNFWATWCPPCKAEMPAMQQLHERSQSKVQIVSINIDPQNDVEGFIDEFKLTFPVLLDLKAEINNKYNILSIPTTFLIDENGVISKKQIGSMNLDQMMDLIG